MPDLKKRDLLFISIIFLICGMLLYSLLFLSDYRQDLGFRSMAKLGVKGSLQMQEEFKTPGALDTWKRNALLPYFGKILLFFVPIIYLSYQLKKFNLRQN